MSYKGKALPNAKVTFLPIGDTKGIGGSGQTDKDGSYEVTYNRGGTGLPAGEYRVTISQRLNPDGSQPDPDVSPIESQATERIPAKYSSEDSSKLTKRISDTTTDYDFSLGN